MNTWQDKRAFPRNGLRFFVFTCRRRFDPLEPDDYYLLFKCERKIISPLLWRERSAFAMSNRRAHYRTASVRFEPRSPPGRARNYADRMENYFCNCVVILLLFSGPKQTTARRERQQFIKKGNLFASPTGSGCMHTADECLSLSDASLKIR